MMGKLGLSIVNSDDGISRFKYSELRWWVI